MNYSGNLVTTSKKKILINMADLSLLLMVFIIEIFFVVAPMAGNYKVIIILCSLSFLCAVVSAVVNNFRIIQDRFSLIMYLCIGYFILRAIIEGEYIALFFYVYGISIVTFVGGYKRSINKDVLFGLLKFMAIVFTVGVLLQLVFTEKFMTYYYPLFEESYKTSIRRQVVYHKMYPGWTSQTFATGINLMLGSFACWVDWRKKKKKIDILLLFFFMLGIIVTGKRATLLFTVLSIIGAEILVVKNLSQIIKRFLKYIILMLVLIVLAVVFINSGLSVSRNSLVRFAEMFNSDSDISNGRFVLWMYAIQIFLNNPIFGIGWLNYHDLAFTNLGEDIQVHNTYLQIMCETGIIGIILFLLLLGYLFNKSIKLNRLTGDPLIKMQLLIQLYMIMYAMTGNIMYDYNVLLTIFMSFILYQHTVSGVRRGIYEL